MGALGPERSSRGWEGMWGGPWEVWQAAQPRPQDGAQFGAPLSSPSNKPRKDA